jgi:general secretion pathway protein C
MLALLLLASVSVPPDLAAVGTIVSARPGGSVVILRSAGRSRVVGIGESAFGGRILAITARTVLLDFDGEPRELRLLAGEAPVAVAAPRPAPARASRHPEEGDPRSRDRRDVERRLSLEVPRILAETTIMPVSDGGQQVGFTLTRIPEGTLLTDAGLRPGDVLTRVNDTPIDSLATLISLWPKLQAEPTLRAVVLRNGQPLALTVNLR